MNSFVGRVFNLFNQKSGNLSIEKEVFDIVLRSSVKEISFLYEQCFDNENKEDYKLKLNIFAEIVKNTGADFVLKAENKIKKYEMPLLHYCIMKNNIAFICILMKNKVNINVKTKKNYNVFHMCVIENDDDDVSLLKFFLSQKNTVLNDGDDERDTALSAALKTQKFKCAKLLMENDVDLLIKSDDDLCAIEVLMEYITAKTFHNKSELPGLLDVVIKRGKDNNDIKKCVIDLAIEKCKKEVFELIINEYEDVIGEYDMISAIIESKNENKNEILDYMIKTKKYDYKYVNYDGITLLDYLLSYNYYEHIVFLMTNNDPKEILLFEKNNYEKNRLNNKIYAMYEYVFIRHSIIINEYGNASKSQEDVIKLIKLLIEYGININEKYFDYYPIEYAIKYCNADIIEELINLGANINFSMIKPQVFTYGSNQDLLTLAVKYDNNSCVKLLVDKEIKVQYVNMSNNCKIPAALIMSIMKDNHLVFKYLCWKYIDLKDAKIKNLLIHIAKKDSSNVSYFENIFKYEHERNIDRYVYIDRLIQRFIPFINENKKRTHMQLIKFTKLIVELLYFNNVQYVYNVIEAYNSLLDSIAPNNELLTSFINIVVFVGGFRTDYVIKKYLLIINNLSNNDNKDKFAKYAMIDNFIKCVYKNGYHENLSKIQHFHYDLKFRCKYNDLHNEKYDGLCKKNNNNYYDCACNDYLCEKCGNIFHKENINGKYEKIFSKTIKRKSNNIKIIKSVSVINDDESFNDDTYEDSNDIDSDNDSDNSDINDVNIKNINTHNKYCELEKIKESKNIIKKKIKQKKSREINNNKIINKNKKCDTNSIINENENIDEDDEDDENENENEMKKKLLIMN
ncbi:ankyrin repeat domain-containing protein [Bodo saltans virus]|uniref:Ankyrin repeat domain-containing protein n=1 Tax=Bodo saltans virus TaxID=2024608 RepID=A0A2H4UW36_9VIRU|nr:ankyrin repeat domain-containing protein [Bodo saltans virus]ATZ81158.1 ankyrin repeat domain-containing protein [Bodo saltans virus]